MNNSCDSQFSYPCNERLSQFLQHFCASLSAQSAEHYLSCENPMCQSPLTLLNDLHRAAQLILSHTTSTTNSQPLTNSHVAPVLPRPA